MLNEPKPILIKQLKLPQMIGENNMNIFNLFLMGCFLFLWIDWFLFDLLERDYVDWWFIRLPLMMANLINFSMNTRTWRNSEFSFNINSNPKHSVVVNSPIWLWFVYFLLEMRKLSLLVSGSWTIWYSCHQIQSNTSHNWNPSVSLFWLCFWSSVKKKREYFVGLCFSDCDIGSKLILLVQNLSVIYSYLLASYARFLWDTDVDEEDDKAEESCSSPPGFAHGTPHHSPLAAAS